jgi:hypothetical protein
MKCKHPAHKIFFLEKVIFNLRNYLLQASMNLYHCAIVIIVILTANFRPLHAFGLGRQQSAGVRLFTLIHFFIVIYITPSGSRNSFVLWRPAPGTSFDWTLRRGHMYCIHTIKKKFWIFKYFTNRINIVY